MPRTSSNSSTFRSPVVILAGGAGKQGDASTEAARKLLLPAFSGFSGTLISGGTREGIAAITGEIAEACPRAQVIGYIPKNLGKVPKDRRYGSHRSTLGKEFTVAESLLYWSDLVAAGVDPEEVKLIGWGGGIIAAFEYRLALLLGAKAGIVSGSGRSADALENDPTWAGHAKLAFLPQKQSALRRFIGLSK